MKAKLFLLFFIIFIYSNHISAQNKYTIIVLDRESKTPIEGCTIINKYNNHISSTNKYGECHFSDISKQDTFLIKSIEHEYFLLKPVTNNNTSDSIFLMRKYYLLPDVLVNSMPTDKSVIVSSGKPDYNNTLIAMEFNCAIYFPNTTNTNSKLKRIFIPLKDNKSNTENCLVLKITKANSDGTPSNVKSDIIQEAIRIIPNQDNISKKRGITLDFKEKNLDIPQDGFCIILNIILENPGDVYIPDFKFTLKHNKFKILSQTTGEIKFIDRNNFIKLVNTDDISRNKKCKFWHYNTKTNQYDNFPDSFFHPSIQCIL